jgi:hypothetical protein
MYLGLLGLGLSDHIVGLGLGCEIGKKLSPLTSIDWALRSARGISPGVVPRFLFIDG